MLIIIVLFRSFCRSLNTTCKAYPSQCVSPRFCPAAGGCRLLQTAHLRYVHFITFSVKSFTQHAKRLFIKLTWHSSLPKEKHTVYCITNFVGFFSFSLIWNFSHINRRCMVWWKHAGSTSFMSDQISLPWQIRLKRSCRTTERTQKAEKEPWGCLLFMDNHQDEMRQVLTV